MKYLIPMLLCAVAGCTCTKDNNNLSVLNERVRAGISARSSHFAQAVSKIDPAKTTVCHDDIKAAFGEVDAYSDSLPGMIYSDANKNGIIFTFFDFSKIPHWDNKTHIEKAAVTGVYVYKDTPYTGEFLFPPEARGKSFDAVLEEIIERESTKQ